MTTLIDRLSKLDGPDREVDAEVFAETGENLPAQFLGIDLKLQRQEDGSYAMPVGGMMVRYEVPAYTASVDAAIALAERVLPGANVLIGWGQTKETKPWARIGVIPSHDATGPNLAIALCIAILRAKEANHGE